MGIFNSIKKLFSTPTQTNTNENTTPKPNREKTPPPNKTIYYEFLKRYKYKKLNSVSMSASTEPSWDSFFSVSKVDPKLIGFEKRSRKKFRHLYHDEDLIIAEAAGVIELVTKDKVEQISLKETPLEKMRCVTASDKGIILQNKEQVALLNLKTYEATLYDFQWQAFSFAIAKDYWLVGTRKTYEGPGELYCFHLNGELNWGIAFQEKIATMFGEFEFMPYILQVSTDSTDIFVASMDRLYRLDPEGNLHARIAISELKESELQQKYEELQRTLAVPPKTEEEAIDMYATELAAQFMMGFERATFTSPFKGFAHDSSTDMLFVLEEKGRVSGWDRHGQLVWLNTFKTEGRYIAWIDEKVVISFITGETFWLNRDGQFIYGAKLPKQAVTISLIPSQPKYLIVSEDNRLYELHKDTGHLITGSEGHPGMELFTLSSQNVFFDGKLNGQGYFWLAPPGHRWQHFEAKNFMEASEHDLQSGVAPEITASKNFNIKWEVKSKKGWSGGRIVDVRNQRVYVVEEGPRKSGEQLRKLSDQQRANDWLSNNLVCYDLNGKMIWKKHIYSSMWSMYLSPDGETLFTSMPTDDEITYLPGYILIFSKDGEELDKIKVDAHGFDLDFTSSDSEAIVHFSSEQGKTPVKGRFERDDSGKWSLIIVKDKIEQSNPFGAGLNEKELPHYKLIRTDKKKYLLSTENQQIELKLAAAIYEAYETVEGKLVVRIGTRLVSFYDQQLEKALEIKEQESIQSLSIGQNSLVILSKGEIRGFNHSGELLWRFSAIPKSTESKVTWQPEEHVYLWIVSNNQETIVAAISEEGTVLRSQSFNKAEYPYSITTDPETQTFVAQSNEVIRIYHI
ncbi:ornithine cyclodeaminase [Ureibacillus composti]|nr:ornithine cyclodeaminase [Ureibacillus composti]